MGQKEIYILGIESSCDDTSAAITCNDKILANIVAGQDVHRQYGGVVPELASRSHQANIVPVVDLALRTANIAKNRLHAIAFTRGPGLLGSLMVGTSFAKGFSMGMGIPMIDVHHMQAHILAHFIDGANVENTGKPSFPFLCLTISGGHTQIVLVEDPARFTVLGETIDDAAGEAFDKIAKLLDLPYPGGPEVDKRARSGDPHRFAFAIPSVPGLGFSFSGLKTSFLYFLRDAVKKNPQFASENLNDLCASFQHTVVNILIEKIEKAATEHGISCIAVAGGVSANSYLREKLREKALAKGWELHIPDIQYCTDNAAMIAVAGYYKYLREDFATQDISAAARVPIA